MTRLTFNEKDGSWGVVGMNADNEQSKVYGCLCKLRDYEEYGLDPHELGDSLIKLREYENITSEPADIIRLKNKLEDIEENLQVIEKQASELRNSTEFVHIGSEIHGYIVKGISEKCCLAERQNKIGLEDFVVWNIDADFRGVNNGRYLSDFSEALSKFAELTFVNHSDRKKQNTKNQELLNYY